MAFQTKRTFELATNHSRIHQVNLDDSLWFLDAAFVWNEEGVFVGLLALYDRLKTFCRVAGPSENIMSAASEYFVTFL